MELRNKGVAFFIASCLITTIAISIAIIPYNASGYTFHNPIYINGNSDFTLSNGVVSGTGSSTNPFIIQGWEIDASAVWSAIEIRNTNAYFIIRNVNVYAGYDTIYFYNVENGKIENSELSNANFFAIFLEYSTNCEIIGNTFFNTIFCGVSLEYSTNINIQGNSFDYGGINIWGDTVSHYNTHTITTDNSVFYSPIYYYKDASEISVENIFIGQLFIVNSNNVKVSNLQIEYGTVNILMAYVENAIITDCEVSGGWVGIEFDYSSDSIISGNNAHDNLDGAYLFSSDNITISSNAFVDNMEYGICFEHSTNSIIVGNAISNNVLGINLDMSTGIISHHNNLVNNGSPQVVDNKGFENSWDDGPDSGGNYWSDYAGSDGNSDGFGDSSYNIDVNSRDNYPLMNQHINKKPSSNLIVNPTIGNKNTTFIFDASQTSDLEDPSVILQIRFDWEDDGNWDTSWLTNKTTLHKYALDGNYTIRLEVRDKGGLTDEITQFVIVDSVKPLLSIQQESGTIINSNNTTFSWTCSDILSGIDYFEYCLDNGSFISCGNSTSINLTSLSNGDYKFTVRAYDKAGNMAWDEITFKVNISIDDEEGETEGFGDSILLIGIIAAVIILAAISIFYIIRKKKPPLVS